MSKEQEIKNIILNHIDSKKEQVCGLIDDLIAEIGDRERIKNAPLNQLASAVSTLIDKFSLNEKSSGQQSGKLDEIFEYFKDVK